MQYANLLRIALNDTTEINEAMRCISPVKKNRDVNGTSFKQDHPCGQCMPCRITKRQEWTYRILMELREHPHNYFVTLTYDDKHLPQAEKYTGGTLLKRDLQLFFKKLRKRGQEFRYFAVGEYGDEPKYRAHYHVILFMKYELPLYEKIIKGKNQIICKDIIDAWDKCDIYDVSPIPSTEDGRKVAQYVSGYCLKKITNDKTTQEYFGDDRQPEFFLASRGTTCRQHRGKGRRPLDCDQCTFGIGFKAAAGIAAGIARYKGQGSEAFDRQDSESIYMARYNGKLYPLSRTFRDKITEHLGGDGRSDTLRALSHHSAITKSEYENREPSKYIEKLYDEEQRRLRAENYAKRQKKYTNQI